MSSYLTLTVVAVAVVVVAVAVVPVVRVGCTLDSKHRSSAVASHWHPRSVFAVFVQMPSDASAEQENWA